MSQQNVYMGEGCQPAPIPSYLFRTLADLARKGYYTPSDLMHDAAWITRHVDGPMTFYWATRPGGGTSIGDERGWMTTPGDGATVYRVTIAHEERGHWTATIEEVDA